MSVIQNAFSFLKAHLNLSTYTNVRMRVGLTDAVLLSLLPTDSKVYRKTNVHKILNLLNAANRNAECYFSFHALARMI